MTLLAPTVVGPLSPLSPSVSVEGVWDGALVEILVNGASMTPAAPAQANTTSVDVVPSKPLPAGAAVTARWTFGGEPASPQSPAVTVLALPTALAAPRFAAPLMTGADFVWLDGLYPGAKLHVQDAGGAIVGQATARRGAEVVRLTFSGYLATGATLTAVQSVKGLSSPPGSSPAAVAAWREPAWPPAPLVDPVSECARAVHVSGLIPSCHAILETAQGVLDFPVVRFDEWLTLPGQVQAGQRVRVTNRLERIGFSSDPTDMTVGPALPLRKPTLRDTLACPSGGYLAAENLTPLAKVTVNLSKGTTPRSLGWGGVPAQQTTRTFPIEDLSGDAPGEIVLHEDLCPAVTAADSDALAFQGGKLQDPPKPVDPLACARSVLVEAGAGIVRVLSDDPSWPVLSDPVGVGAAQSQTWVRLYRPLHISEAVQIESLRGCVDPAHRIGPRVPVKPRGDPIINPANVPLPGKDGVYLRTNMPGSSVQIRVNGLSRAFVEALPSPDRPSIIDARTRRLDVGLSAPLAANDTVTIEWESCNTWQIGADYKAAYTDFVLVPIYWGQQWQSGPPFSWQMLESAIARLIGSRYIDGLRDWGIGSLHHHLASGLAQTPLPATAHDPTVGFDQAAIKNVIIAEITSGAVPGQHGFGGLTPQYMVMVEQGCHYPANTKAAGYWYGESYNGEPLHMAWVMQDSTVDRTLPLVAHELAEGAIEQEVSNACEWLRETLDGASVQPYLSADERLCITPTLPSRVPINGKTGDW